MLCSLLLSSYNQANIKTLLEDSYLALHIWYSTTFEGLPWLEYAGPSTFEAFLYLNPGFTPRTLSTSTFGLSLLAASYLALEPEPLTVVPPLDALSDSLYFLTAEGLIRVAIDY